MNKTNFKSLVAVLLTVLMVFSIVPMFAVSAEETSATISFANVANRTTLNNNQQVWKQNGITVTNDKGASTSNVADYSNPVRFYASSNVTVEYPGITKMVIDCNSKKAEGPAALKGALKTERATVAIDGMTVTITFAAAVDKVEFVKLNKQTQVNSITVYAEAEEGGETPEPTPIFGDNVTVNNADELLQYVAEANAASALDANATAGKTLTIGTDIDLTGKTSTPLTRWIGT